MNNFLHGFWYRPLWLRTLVMVLFICLFLLLGYYGYWQSRSQIIHSLNEKNSHIKEDIQEISRFITHNPALTQLSAHHETLTKNQYQPMNMQAFFTHLQTIVEKSNVILNQIQPSETKEQIQIEIQGNFALLNQFIHQIIAEPLINYWRFTAVTLKTKHGYLTANITLSLMTTNLFIKDENNDEQ